MNLFAKKTLLVCSALLVSFGGCRKIGSPNKIRVAFFPNLTHAPAMVGLAQGTFQNKLGPGIQIETSIFNAGPSAVEALFARAVDLAYVGAGPAINAYVKSGGEFRIVAGCASGGAALVLRKGLVIRNASDWNGKRIATPQIGNTQDIALRSWLSKNSLKTSDKGGSVQIVPVSNPDQLTLMQKGELDAAWTVEPWVSRMVSETGGQIFMQESSIWKPLTGGDYATSVIVAGEKFARENPDLLIKWISAHCDAAVWIESHRAEAEKILESELVKITKAPLPETVMRSAFANIKFTYDPLRKSLEHQARSAFEQGFLGRSEPDLSRLCNLDYLNKTLLGKKLKTLE